MLLDMLNYIDATEIPIEDRRRLFTLMHTMRDMGFEIDSFPTPQYNTLYQMVKSLDASDLREVLCCDVDDIRTTYGCHYNEDCPSCVCRRRLDEQAQPQAQPQLHAQAQAQHQPPQKRVRVDE
jgi:hypothetical protein